jgi:hypothetical protein
VWDKDSERTDENFIIFVFIFTSNNHTRIPCKRAGIHACMAEDLFGEWHSPRQVGLLVRESTDLAKLANPRMMIIIFTTVLNGPEARGGEGAKHADQV